MNTQEIEIGFTPIVVTAETLQRLAKEDKYPELLAMYMAYVEITTWQETKSVKATKSFMMKRLKWGVTKYHATKNKLISMNLIENITRRGDDGKISGYFVHIKHIGTYYQDKKSVPIIEPPLESHTLVPRTPSTTNYKDEPTNTKIICEVSKNKELFYVLVGELGFTDKVHYTTKRIKWMRDRLKSFTPEELVRVARIIRNDDYLQGENPGAVRYGTIDYLIRSDEIPDNKLASVGDDTAKLDLTTLAII